MLRKGALRVAAYAQVQRTCGGAAAGGTRAWLSGKPVGSNDDPTPAETKLAFASTVYGKDPSAAAELTPAQATTAEKLKKAAAPPASGVATSKGHDPRAMFDSSLSQQAEDGKPSEAIKRDVATDTPDATRVAFRASDYGKDPQTTAELSEKEAAEIESLQGRVRQGAGAAAGAAPVHDSRNMFDSDLSQGAGSSPAADSIKRHVATDTPDATRVAFRASAYGKDPQGSAEYSAQEAAEVEALRSRVPRAAVAAAPVHDNRNMFDSDLAHGAASTPSSDSIKRDVVPDTPEATRLVFGGSDYGKDPLSMARTAEKQAEMDALAARAAATGRGGAAPIHHDRSMFDSELTQSSGVVRNSDAIKRDVSADTPEATRLVFGGSDYGKDPLSMTRSAEKQAEIDALAARAKAAAVGRAKAAPIHHDRSLFDSDLTQSAGVMQNSDAIKRDVVTGTPENTRLAFGGSDYGKDQNSMARSVEMQAKMDALAAASEGGNRARRATAPVHHDRSMFDSDLTQGAGGVKESASIKRQVVADTPELTRLSFFGSTCESIK